jgi:hypothetical protein
MTLYEQSSEIRGMGRSLLPFSVTAGTSSPLTQRRKRKVGKEKTTEE